MSNSEAALTFVSAFIVFLFYYCFNGKQKVETRMAFVVGSLMFRGSTE
jgi:hypothetical protein